MKRRGFFYTAAESIFLSKLFPASSAGSAGKTESAFRLPIGRQLPDPFCLREGNGWYLTGTNSSRKPSENDYVFDMFYSQDLVNWVGQGPILKVPDYEGSRQANYWAPEIMPYGGKYYLYYTADSFGDPERRFVRVAVSDRITGPYTDSGRALTSQPSIDGHPFVVSEKEIYLFYTGNEGNDHVGQLLVERMISPVELENKPARVFPFFPARGTGEMEPIM